MSWYGEYLTTAHVHFKNTEPKVENDQSSDFDVRIVRAGVPGVFPSPLIGKKNNNRSVTTWCPLIKSLSLFLCVHRKQTENKRL